MKNLLVVCLFILSGFAAAQDVIRIEAGDGHKANPAQTAEKPKPKIKVKMTEVTVDEIAKATREILDGKGIRRASNAYYAAKREGRQAKARGDNKALQQALQKMSTLQAAIDQFVTKQKAVDKAQDARLDVHGQKIHEFDKKFVNVESRAVKLEVRVKKIEDAHLAKRVKQLEDRPASPAQPNPAPANGQPGWLIPVVIGTAVIVLLMVGLLVWPWIADWVEDFRARPKARRPVAPAPAQTIEHVETEQAPTGYQSAWTGQGSLEGAWRLYERVYPIEGRAIRDGIASPETIARQLSEFVSYLNRNYRDVPDGYEPEYDLVRLFSAESESQVAPEAVPYNPFAEEPTKEPAAPAPVAEPVETPPAAEQPTPPEGEDPGL